MTSRRRCIELGAFALAPPLLATRLPAVAAQLEVAQSVPAPASPALGERIHWPPVRLLDGRPMHAPVPGEAASVIVFFSTTCPFCARHNVHVQKLLQASRGTPLRILAVAQDRSEANIRTYLQRRGLDLDVTMEDAAMRKALTTLKGVPITCAVDRQQCLREVIRGEMFEEDVLALARWATKV